MTGAAAGPAPPDQAARWDARYAATDEPPFGDRPSALLRRAHGRPATALMLADGDGRNGTWLARQGVRVTAVDLSVEATRRAIARDRAAGVRPRRIVADLATWRPPAGRRWQAVTVIFLQAEPELRRRVLRLAAGALAPGGRLIVEGFARPRAARQRVGPEDPLKLYDGRELRAWLPGLRIRLLRRRLVHLDEGPRHRGIASLIRLVAERSRRAAQPPRSGKNSCWPSRR